MDLSESLLNLLNQLRVRHICGIAEHGDAVQVAGTLGDRRVPSRSSTTSLWLVYPRMR